uniref:WD40 repeat-containing protein SMU1 n=1 Tax=Globisporangium ultimum (strain ATCC 200006 / CBS 805.95 / DAOM BR144) TaxID=431595 RepID=K3WH88_GLOUD
MNELEVDAGDAVRLILQFLKENHLFHAMRALQEESQISLNAVDSRDTFLADVRAGRWESVLQQTKALECSPGTMMELYEQIALEMLEMHEHEVALQLLRSTPPMAHMKKHQPERYLRLEKLAQKAIFDPVDAYAGLTKEKKRDDIAQLFQTEVTSVAPSRLLSLLGQALKWQQMQGAITPGADFDLFRGAPKETVAERTEKIIRKSAGKIKFSKTSAPQCAQFSRDGRMLITGTKDGFVEVWDYEKCKLRKDLEYQAKDEFMMHDDERGVTAQAFSRDGEMLATGSDDGKVKVWKLSSGVCLRRFDNAHSQSVHSIAFSRDGTQLLTSSFDQLIRIHGLKSGQTLKEFHGHESYVNSAVFSKDGSRIVSSSSDGTVKIWDVKTAECLHTIRPPNASYGAEVDILSVHLIPSPLQGTTGENIVLCTRSNAMFLLGMDGEPLLTYKVDPIQETAMGNFVGCALSSRAKWLYGVTDKGHMLCYATATAALEMSLQVTNGDAFGVAHHPHRNLVATFGSDGYVRMWKA